MPQNYPRRLDDKRINLATRARMLAWKKMVEATVKHQPQEGSCTQSQLT